MFLASGLISFLVSSINQNTTVLESKFERNFDLYLLYLRCVFIKLPKRFDYTKLKFKFQK